MTSEVCVMNRHALVLAADSATTVSQWTGEKREIRYFKGANKIFQVSNHHPVGLMIFDGADILGVPWEIIAKRFRAQLDNKSFNTIEGYAEEFCEFLEGDPTLFPAEVQKEAVFSAIKAAAYGMALEVRDRDGVADEDWTAHFDALIAAERVELDAVASHVRLPQDFLDATLAGWKLELTAEITAYLADPVPQPTDYESLTELAFLMVAKNPGLHLGTTGLVFCGYGDHDIFPSYVHNVSSGMFAGKHLLQQVKREAVTHSVPAQITGFAQTGMIDTFQLGVDSEVFRDVVGCFDNSMVSFVEALTAGGADQLPADQVAKMRSDARKKFMDEWFEKTRNQHIYPLKRVLASLPISEMAELAETLINLQSLKEKVTKPSETVGGPIDVAVITKSEGLVWIKRKHYFDPALNARFMARHVGLYS